MNIFILFGITGDLARKKIIPALAALEQRQGLSLGKHLIIGAGRKPEPPQEFGDLKKSEYVRGELDEASLYIKLKKRIYSEIKKAAIEAKGAGISEDSQIIVYSSLPPHMHVLIARLFTKHMIDKALNKKLNIKVRFLIEKPLGTNLASAEKDLSVLRKLLPSDQLYFVDHYLFKDSIFMLKKMIDANPSVLRASIGSPAVKEIRVVLYEDMNVAERGAFYDEVGALNDVGQNHLLQLLAELLLIREKIWLPGAGIGTGNGAGRLAAILARASSVKAKNKPVKGNSTKAKIMDALQPVGDPVFGQYKGYLDTKNIKSGSKTETFFHVTMQYHGLRCIISSGKALDIKRSGVHLKYIDPSSDIFIDMNAGNPNAYVSMFEEALSGNQSAFAQEDEIIAGWKFVQKIKKKRKNNLVYSALHDILVE